MDSKRFFETSFRLSRREAKDLTSKGLYVYARRLVDGQITIERNAGSNFLRTLITNFEIAFPKDGPLAGIILFGDRFLQDMKAEKVAKLSDVSRYGDAF